MTQLISKLSAYKSAHLNNKNVATHFVGIPLILWSIALLLSTITLSSSLNLMQVVAIAVFIYYITLDAKLGLFAIAFIAPIFYSANSFSTYSSPYTLALLVFVVGWVLQFIGHYFEKAKPAFFDDIKQLLIGPLFLVAEVCFVLKLFKDIEDEVTRKAVVLRTEIEKQ